MMIATENENDEVRLYIMDNGNGMTPRATSNPSSIPLRKK